MHNQNSKFKRISLLAGATLFLNLAFFNAGTITDEDLHPKGLAPLTPDEFKKLHTRKIIKVKANRRSIDRLNKELAKQGRPQLDIPADDGSDVEIQAGAATDMNSTTTSTFGASPAQVDNSALPAFPNIGNQGSLPSCVAWATTYYQMSHEVCLTLGCDNKVSKSKVFSPKWTYNLINGGAAAGTFFSSAYGIESAHGAAQYTEFPYDSNYRAWSLNPIDWKNAINYRMSSVSYSTNDTDAGIAATKQLLANGHVLVIGTYINSWVFGTVGAAPNQANPFAGQYAVMYQNGTSGAHAMTLVGYDDSIWIDINSNGIVDSGEMGAFKIANSWGASWRNAGFAWASYDSFRSVSAISNFAPTGRIKLAQSGSNYMVSFTPKPIKALAKLRVSHLTRNQMSISLGSSSTSVTTPQTSFSLPALRNAGGAFAFDGNTTELEGTFYADLSDLISSDPNQHLFYLTAADNTSGNNLSAFSFEVVDPNSDATLFSAAGVPAFLDATSKIFIAGDYTPDTSAPTAPSNLTATIKTVKKGKTIKKSVALTWGASRDNAAVTGYIIYRNGVKLTQVSSLSYSDSTVSSGSYTYEVLAIDSSGNVSMKSNAVNVSL